MFNHIARSMLPLCVFPSNIICRYPISSQEYKPIPIKNDEGVELLLEVPSRAGVYCVEIYLEEKPAPLKG